METHNQPPAPKASALRRAARSPSDAKPNRTTPSASDPTEQLVFTIQAHTGKFLKAEKVDGNGTRSDISLDEAQTMVRTQRSEMIEAVLDEAFEAGISSIIDPGSDNEVREEPSEEDAEIRKILLHFIIGPETRDHIRERIINQFALDHSVFQW
jgi:hypothetical protein